MFERRGEPVTELRPLTETSGLAPEAKARIWAQMEEIWSELPQSTLDSSKILEENRDR
jgi:hypothetical protein